VQWRAQVIAQWPPARALIDPLCEAIGCASEAPRRLDALTVESTALTRLGAPGAYRLSVVLHNRAAVPVLAPAVELSLTDSQGQLVARKALTAAQLGAAQSSVPGGGEATLQAAFTMRDRPVIGYTVEIFYP